MDVKTNNYGVILAGGVGRRLWPDSTTHKPKQFLDLFGVGRTLLQQSYDRFLKIVPLQHIFVSTFTDYAKLVEEQLPDLPKENILVEPVQLGTGPAVAWANCHIEALDPSANIIISPSDLQILNENEFIDSVTKGFQFVSKTENFLALAVKPSFPETGYGYIQISDQVTAEGFAHVQSFTEKPDIQFAKMFVESGEFFWNTGLFMWNVKTMHTVLEKLIPNMMAHFEEATTLSQVQENAFIREYYPSSLYLSIDIIILEKATNVYAECGKFGWADLGQWGSLYDVSEKDDNGNVVLNSRVIMHDCKNNIIRLPKDKIAVLQGLDGFILAQQGDIIFLCKNGDASLVRRLVNEAQMALGEPYV